MCILVRAKRLSPCRLPALFELLAPEINSEIKKPPFMWMRDKRWRVNAGVEDIFSSFDLFWKVKPVK